MRKLSSFIRTAAPSAVALACLMAPAGVAAQDNARYVADVRQLVEKEAWARDVVDRLRSRTQEFVDSGDGWLADRLQMHWNSRAAQTYVKGNFFSHCAVDSAPAPTVRMAGARSHATDYARPNLRELPPKADYPQGMWLRNNKLPGKPYEWAAISQTGGIINSINNEIMNIARDAAFLWHLDGDEAMGRLAAEVFDTFVTGIYYKRPPRDVNNGHIGTLVGFTTFEVIHEDALNPVVEIYDFLRPYLVKNYSEKIAIYDAALKKWADLIIDHGVPHNNWNLMQARAILKVGQVLGDNSSYGDGKGREYYTDYVLNKSSIRQWSLKELAAAGYDPSTGIWSECPGYSQVVINDYTDFVDIFRRDFNIDLLEEIPVIGKAAEALPQYLFPDGMIAAFGDTHPGGINPAVYKRLIKNARHFGKKDDEKKYTSLYLLAGGKSDDPSDMKPRVAVSSFYGDTPLILNPEYTAADIDSVVTPSFHAPNASWVALRNGMNRDASLMAVVNGSEGNHMHANGISLELYGKGLRMAPDGGIGYQLYSGDDYLEYYSQFPAHNTVCVDGISSYPVMKSNHPVKPLSIFPPSQGVTGYTPLSYADIYFLEPETQSDQRRLVGIINTSDSTGYYVDIFRSRRKDGCDKTHDYFYHNLGQKMSLSAADGQDLGLSPTEELAFAGAHLYAYSYIFDKMSADTDADVLARFDIEDKDKTGRSMTMWMKGETERTVFKALSPSTEGLSRLKNNPYDMRETPTLTYVARQRGEAWTRPFVAVLEPTSATSPSKIKKVEYPAAGNAQAVSVTLEDGSSHLILSSDDNAVVSAVDGMKMKATYAVSTPESVLMGNGTYLKTKDIEIKTSEPGDVMVEEGPDGMRILSTVKATIKTKAGKTVVKPNI